MTGEAAGWLTAAASLETADGAALSSEDPKIPQPGGEELPEEGETDALTDAPEEEECAGAGANPDLWLYRDRTEALLRRYARLSVEVGRLPSLLGREFFRTRVTSYTVQTFEDTVVFVLDVERCLDMLNAVDKLLIAMIALQEYSPDETARAITCHRSTVFRGYGEGLDRLTEIFLKREILRRLPPKTPDPAEACQEGKMDGFPATDSK